jgi:hypothetical protein
LDCVNDSWVCPATADVSLHGVDNFIRLGRGIFLEQGDAGENHARRAVSALKRVGFEEGLLQSVQLSVLFQPFNGRDVFSGGGAGGRNAGPRRFSVEQHRTGATLSLTASILGAGEVQVFPKDIQQTTFGVSVDPLGASVDEQLNLHRGSLSILYPFLRRS